MKQIPLTVLTHSSEACFKCCPRKYYLRYELGYRPAHAANALRTGGAFHAGVEAFRNRSYPVAAVEAYYAATSCPPWMTGFEYEVERATAVAMVRGYAAHYADDPIVRYVAVEKTFEIPIVNPYTRRKCYGMRSAGKIDAIVKLPDDRLAILEEKTVGIDVSPEADYWKRLLMDSQISRYFLAARAIGYDVQTIIYSVTRKPSIRPRAVSKAEARAADEAKSYFGLSLSGPCPSSETPQMFGARLLADMIKKPDFYFARVEIPRLDSDLDEYAHEQWTMQRTIRRAQLDARDAGASAFPRNTGACLMWGRCEFLDVCRGLCGDPNEQIPDGFVVAADRHPELSVTEAGD